MGGSLMTEMWAELQVVAIAEKGDSGSSGGGAGGPKIKAICMSTFSSYQETVFSSKKTGRTSAVAVLPPPHALS